MEATPALKGTKPIKPSSKTTKSCIQDVTTPGAGVPNLGRASATGEVAKENPNHDELGRFASGDGGGARGEKEVNFGGPMPGIFHDKDAESKATAYIKGLNAFWQPKLSKDEAQAIYAYTEREHLPLNRFLRGDDEVSSDSNVPRISNVDKSFKIARIDSAISKFTTEKPMVVYRNLNGYQKFGEPGRNSPSDQVLVGDKTYLDKGYVSTSLLAMSETPNIVAIHVPAGIHAAPINGHSFKPTEMELLLPRNCVFKVRPQPPIRRDDYLHLDLVK